MMTFNRRRFVYGSGTMLAAPRLAAAGRGAIQLGACLPLTGGLAAQYEQAHQALKLAQDEINGAGGINGRAVKITFEDAQSSGVAALRAFNRLASEITPAAMLLPGNALQVLAVEAAAADKQIPSLHASSAGAVRQRGNSQLFALRPSDSAETEALCRFALEKLGMRLPAILAVNDEAGRSAARQARALVEGAGFAVAAEEFYGQRDDDVSQPLKRAAAAGGDGLIAFARSRDAALIMSGRQALKAGAPLVISGAAAEPAALALADAKDLAGVYTLTGARPGGALAAEFQKRFRYRFQRSPDASAAFYFDGAMLLALVMRTAGAERADIRTGLAAASGFEGAAQTYTADSAGGLAHQVFAVSFKPGTKELQPAAMPGTG